MSLPEPQIQPIAGTNLVQLTAAYELHLPCLRKTLRIAVGFLYDGNSFPPWAWTFTGHPFDPTTLPAATAHDAIYRTHLCSRRKADEIYRTLAIANGLSRARAYFRWTVLRVVGGAAWSQYTPKQIASTRKLVALLPLTQEGNHA